MGLGRALVSFDDPHGFYTPVNSGGQMGMSTQRRKLTELKVVQQGQREGISYSISYNFCLFMLTSPLPSPTRGESYESGSCAEEQSALEMPDGCDSPNKGNTLDLDGECNVWLPECLEKGGQAFHEDLMQPFVMRK